MELIWLAVAVIAGLILGYMTKKWRTSMHISSAEKKAELSRKSCAYKKAKTKAAQEGLPEEECIKLAKKVAQQLTLIYNYVKKHAAHDVNMFLCFKGFTIPVYSPPAGLRHMQRLLETLASDFSIYGEVELQCRI